MTGLAVAKLLPASLETSQVPMSIVPQRRAGVGFIVCIEGTTVVTP